MNYKKATLELNNFIRFVKNEISYRDYLRILTQIKHWKN